MINQDVSQEQLALTTSLAHASETVAGLPYETEFQAYAGDRGVDVTSDETDPLAYWQAVKDFAATELVESSGGSKLDKQSLALIAGLPLSLTQSYYLEAHGQSMSPAGRRELKRGISEYNKTLKEFIEAHPQGSDELKASLLAAALATIGGDSREFTSHAETSIDAHLRGMKHEMAFASVLDSLGVSWREATVEEDLKGRDIIIDFNGQEIGVDVKASLSEVEAHHGDSSRSPVVYDERNNRFIVFSGFVEKDFHGTFKPSSATVDERAPMIGALLQAAIMQQAQKVLR
jgi:hypothetical protein